MRIVFDGFVLHPSSASRGTAGVARWTAATASALKRTEPDWDVGVVCLNESIRDDSIALLDDVSIHRVRWPRLVYRAARVVDRLHLLGSGLGRPDAFVGSAFIPWRLPGSAAVPVVHDLAHVRFPQFVARGNRSTLNRLLPRVLARAPLAVVVSEAVRQEVLDTYGLDPQRVEVVPNCVYPDPRGAEGMGAGEHLLFVGTLEPRKNLIGLLDAYDLARRQSADLPPLVIVGGRGWQDRSLRARLESVDQRAVRVLGYVDDSELSGLYRRARALVYPSYYEGFGLPVLEAMARGCPVVASRIPAIAEVAGDAALLVDPRATDELAAAIVTVSGDDELRSRLVDAGAARAALYSSGRTGAAMRAAAEKAVSLRAG